MEYKLFEKQDIQLMKYFVDDENTKYDETYLELRWKCDTRL